MLPLTINNTHHDFSQSEHQRQAPEDKAEFLGIIPIETTTTEVEILLEAVVSLESCIILNSHHAVFGLKASRCRYHETF